MSDWDPYSWRTGWEAGLGCAFLPIAILILWGLWLMFFG
jgi:hypothetical protein